MLTFTLEWKRPNMIDTCTNSTTAVMHCQSQGKLGKEVGGGGGGGNLEGEARSIRGSGSCNDAKTALLCKRETQRGRVRGRHAMGTHFQEKRTSSILSMLAHT